MLKKKFILRGRKELTFRVESIILGGCLKFHAYIIAETERINRVYFTFILGTYPCNDDCFLKSISR